MANLLDEADGAQAEGDEVANVVGLQGNVVRFSIMTIMMVLLM